MSFLFSFHIQLITNGTDSINNPGNICQEFSAFSGESPKKKQDKSNEETKMKYLLGMESHMAEHIEGEMFLISFLSGNNKNLKKESELHRFKFICSVVNVNEIKTTKMNWL